MKQTKASLKKIIARPLSPAEKKALANKIAKLLEMIEDAHRTAIDLHQPSEANGLGHLKKDAKEIAKDFHKFNKVI